MSFRVGERPAQVRIGLVAGGPDGLALLQLLLTWPAATVVAVVDPLPDGPVLQAARAAGIPATTRPLDVFQYLPVDLVIESTGHAPILDELRRAGPGGIDIVGPQGLRPLRLLLDDLDESLEQQAATGEILRIISSSPTDVQPVFEMIVERVVQLCDGVSAFIYRFDGDLVHLVAHHQSVTSQTLDAFQRVYPAPPSRTSVITQSILDRRVIHVRDFEGDPDLSSASREMAKAAGHRSLLAVPMLQGGAPIGAVAVGRRGPQGGPRPFSAREIALLKTFADQAVIAVENVRLFRELEAKNRDLTETLEQQTATGEILRVISASPTNVQPVFDAIARSAVRLCGARIGAVFQFDGELLHLAAHHNFTPEILALIQRLYPMRPGSEQLSGRAILAKAIVQVEDLLADPEYRQEVAVTGGWRSILAVPMLREGSPLGVISINRAEAGAFSERQIALLQTFADQAVIAIENVRLFKALEAKNRDLTEALEQQTAMAEILRVISSSPTDLQSVMETLARNAARLCEAVDAQIFRVEEGALRLVALTGAIPQWTVGTPTPISRGWVMGRAVVDCQPVHVHDLATASEVEFPHGRTFARELGHRTTLAVPLLREGLAIGAILIRRTEVRPFTDRQIALLETFADQAVIAIENVRLFTELEARNRDLTETLEQQTATSEILRVISSSPTNVQPVFDAIVGSAVRLCDASFGGVIRFDGEHLHVAAAHNVEPERLEIFGRLFPMRATPDLAIGRAILERNVIHFEDVLQLPSNPVREASRLALGYRAWLAVPMLHDGTPLGVIFCWRPEPRAFTAKQIALVQTFADQAVIAIENVRLFKELEAKNRDLTETLEQQTATAEILRVISSSPTDALPVFDTIATNAAQLCGAEFAWVFRFDARVLHFAAQYGLSPAGLAEVRRVSPMPLGRGSAAGRSILNRAIEHIPDVQVEPDYELGATANVMTFRSIVAVPMLRDGVPVGTIVVARARTGLFPDRQTELLKTFADQAVIAIENVRLFQELQARTSDLTRSVEELRALGEVGRAVSSTLDLETVLTTIVSRATQLSGTDAGVIYEYDEVTEAFHPRATWNYEDELVEMTRDTPLRKGEGAVGHMAVTRAPVQIPDILAGRCWRRSRATTDFARSP